MNPPNLALIFRFTVYSLAVFFLLLQIVNCEKNKHCRDDEHCLVNPKPKDKNSNKNSYEATYKKKYESYAAARSSEAAKKAEVAASEKDCNKRKYQLNCSKSWKKAKNGGEGSAKNSKVYIKRENNPLLNLDNDDGDLKKKKQKPEQRKGRPAPPKVQEKQTKKKVK